MLVVRSTPLCACAALLCAMLVVPLRAWTAVATVTMLDGSSASGQITWGDEQQFLLDDRQVDLVDVDRIELVTLSGLLPRHRHVLVLGDGSWLPATIEAGEQPDHVRVDWGGGKPVELELGQVLGWGPSSWLARQQGTERDRVLLADGEELVGRVQGLQDGALQLQVSGLGLLPLPLGQRLTGCRLAIPSKPLSSVHLTTRLVPDGEVLRLLTSPQGLVPAALPEHQAHLPTGAVLQVEGGRRVWLSSLDPITVEEEGAFGVVWPHARDRDLDGEPISLRGRRFDRGLVVHSRARLVWQLDGAYERFQALVGIADTVGREGDCAVIISGDDRVLWQRERVRGGEEPELVQLDLRGVRQLELRVELGERYDIGDHLALAGAWLLRAP